MIGNQERWQEELFVAGSFSSLIPDDHILKLVEAEKTGKLVISI